MASHSPLLLLALLLTGTSAFSLTTSRPFARVDARASAVAMAEREPFDMKVDIPPRGTCNLRFKPLFEASEAVVVKYAIPFGLNVENQGGKAVCTKDGEGGEKAGDVLRYTTKWELGLPPQGKGGSIVGTVASFAGGLSWQLGLLDVAKATEWDEVRHRGPTRSPPVRGSLIHVRAAAVLTGGGGPDFEHGGAHG